MVYALMWRDIIFREAWAYPFFLFSTLIWVAWLLKVVISRGYRPWTKTHRTNTAVIIPVVDEPLDLFADVMQLITGQNPTQVIVVINGARNPGLESVARQYGAEFIWTKTPGKRNAVREGVLALNDTIGPDDPVFLVDSDTIWTNATTGNDGTLAELCKPFADKSIGGVTTRQRILNPERSFYTRWADWLENARSLYSFPAQSRLGAVGCLPGRTIAFRRHILEQVMPEFMGQKFLGVFLEVSDDRTLTNLCLKAGHKTVYQSRSLVFTDAPLRLRKLYKQQLRWARGSSYNSLRMMPWYASNAPFTGFLFLLDLVLPFLLAGTIVGWILRALVTGEGVNWYAGLLDVIPGWHGVALIVAAAVVASCLSMFVRQFRHWAEVPSDLFRIPAFILFSTFFLMPIRLLGFFRMAHAASWGTRSGAYAGGDVEHEPTIVVPMSHHDSVLAPFFIKGEPEARQPDLRSMPKPSNPRVNPLAAVPHILGWLLLAGVVFIAMGAPTP